MDEKSKAVGSVRRFIRIQFIVGLIAVLISLAWLSPIERGWDWEPLCWLAIFWYGLIAIIVQMSMSRGRLSMQSLVVLTTCCVLLIGFPFSSIRKATVRARETNRGAATEHYGWLKLDGWRRLPQGDLLPCCLHWRLPEGFEFPQTEIDFEAAAQVVDARLLRDEVETLVIRVDGKVKPEVIAQSISSIGEMPNLRMVRVDSVHWRLPRSDIRNQLDIELDLPQIRRLHIHSLDAAPNLYRSLLSSSNLVEVQIAGDCVTEAELSQLRSSQLLKFDASDIRAAPQCIERIIAANPNLIELAVGAHHLDASVSRAIETLTHLIQLTVRGDSENQPPSPCFDLAWPQNSPTFEQLSLQKVDISQVDDAVQGELAQLGDRVAFSQCQVGKAYLLSALDMKNQQPNFDAEILLVEFLSVLRELDLAQLADSLQDLDKRFKELGTRQRSPTSSYIQYDQDYEALRYSIFSALREKAMPMTKDESADFATRLQKLHIRTRLAGFNPVQFWICGTGGWLSPTQQKIEDRIAAASK